MKTKNNGLILWALSVYAVCTLISMAIMNIGEVILIAALVYGLGGPRKFISALKDALSEPWPRRFLVVSFILTGACLLSLLVAKTFPLGYDGKFVRVFLFRDIVKCWYLFWPLLLYVAFKSVGPSGVSRVLKVWFSAFALLCMIGVVQYFTGWPRPQLIPSGNWNRYHVTLFIGHHLSVASIFIFPFFAMFDLASRSGFVSGRLGRALIGIALLFGFFALFGTYSRTLWAALPIGLAIYFVWVLPRKWSVAVICSIVLSCVGALQVEAVRSRLTDQLGVGTRQSLWLANLEFFKARPLTGAGWHHNLELASFYFDATLGKGSHFVGHAHNNVIEMLGGTGAIGTIAWLVWCLFVIVMLFKVIGRAEKTPLRRQFAATVFPRALICAWVVFHINGLTQVNFWESKVLHQIAFVTALSMLWLSIESNKPKDSV